MNKSQRKHKVRMKTTETMKEEVYRQQREHLKTINRDHLVKQYAGPFLILGGFLLVILFTGYVIWRAF